MTRLLAVDLFSGAGGLSLGLAAAGFETVLAADSWQPAVDTYTKNFGKAPLCADLAGLTGRDVLAMTGTSVGEVDLLVGGPPCQGFSIQRIGADDDARNNLILDFARFVRAIRPRAFLMENVPGLLGKRGRALSTELLNRLANAGYVVDVQRVNALDYGVPQNRRRVVFIGVKRGQPAFHPPVPKRNRVATVWEAIGDLPSPDPAGSRTPSDPLHVDSRLSKLNRQRLALIPPGGGFEDLPEHLRVRCHQIGAEKIGHRGVYGRLHPQRPSGTITARFDSFTRGRFGHPFEDRNLTLREGARLQTFPDTFEFVGTREEIAAQIGNAVPPRMAVQFARPLASYLTSQ